MAKRGELQKACQSTEAEYVASITLAEKRMNMSHVIKANALKRRCIEIEIEATKLDETSFLLEEKKRKIKIEIKKYYLSLTTSFCLKVNFVKFFS